MRKPVIGKTTYLPDDSESAKPLVAIVDDDASVREAAEGFMRSLGYRAETFASAEEFLVAKRLIEMRCVILDVKLNGMNGLSLQGWLNAVNLRIPIIFMTAQYNEERRLRAMPLGAVDYLQKPCSETALLRAFGTAFKREFCAHQ